MYCYIHPHAEAAGLCSHCGRFICETCKVEWQTKLFCTNCADQVVPEVEPEVLPETIVSIEPGTKGTSKISAEIPGNETKIAIPLVPKSDIVQKPKRICLEQPVRKKPPLRVWEHKPLFPPDYSPKSLGSLFSLDQDFLSTFNIATYVISFFMLAAIFLLPWAVASGFSFYLATSSSILLVFCVIFFIIYLGATVISYGGIRSLIQIICAFFGILLWLIFVVTSFQEISQLSMSPLDMVGQGSIIFLASSILGLLTGILEIHLNAKDFWPRALAKLGSALPKKA